MQELIETIKFSSWNIDEEFNSSLSRINQWFKDNITNADATIEIKTNEYHPDRRPGQPYTIEVLINFFTEESRNLFKLMFHEKEYSYKLGIYRRYCMVAKFICE